MTSSEIEIYKLKMAGVQPEALKTARALQGVIKKLEEQKRAEQELVSKSKGVFEGTRTGAEKYRAKLAELRQMLKGGLIDQTTFNRAVKDLKPPGKGFGFDGAAIARGFALAAGAALGAGIAFGVYAKSQLDATDKAGDLAGRLGIDVADLTRLQYAFKLTGSEAEDVGPALNKLNLNLSDAARNAAGPAATAFRRLGLSAKDLLGKSPSENVLAISTAFQQIKNPADRAAIAMDIFGKGGVNVINSLKAGGPELQKFMNEADKLGITVSAADAEMAGAANDAVDRIWGAFGGLGKRIAVGVAPYLTELADDFLKWATTGDAGASMVSAGLDTVGKTVAFLADGFNALKAVWQGTQAAISLGAALFLDSISAMGHGLESLINLFPGMHVGFAGAIDAMSADLKTLAGDQWKEAEKTLSTPPGAGISGWFDGVKTKADDAAKAINGSAKATGAQSLASADLAEKLKAQADEMTKSIALAKLQLAATAQPGKTAFDSGAEGKLYDLKHAGATDADLAGLKASTAQLENLQKQVALMDELKGKAKGYLEASLTPLQKFKKERDEIAKNPFLNQQQKNQAVGKVFKDTVGKDQDHRPGALEAGSKEARSLILDNQNPDKNRTLEQIGKEQLQQQEETNRLLAGRDKTPGKTEGESPKADWFGGWVRSLGVKANELSGPAAPGLPTASRLGEATPPVSTAESAIADPRAGVMKDGGDGWQKELRKIAMDHLAEARKQTALQTSLLAASTGKTTTTQVIN